MGSREPRLPTGTGSALGVDRPSLSVDPARWWLGVGNSTALTAAWIPGTPGCSVTPSWFLWTEVGGPPLGSLSSSSGAIVNFTAVANETGTESVSVRSAGTFDCGSSSAPALATAAANVTVVAALALTNLSVGPGPVRPGTTVNLTGSVVGGVAPYSAEIAWADGSRSSVALDRSGPFSVPHTYPGGQFLPQVSIEDVLGSTTTALAPQAIEVSDQAASGIETAVDGAEVETPVLYSVRFARAPEGYPPFSLCDGLPPDWIDLGPSTENFSCSFARLGPATVIAGLGSPNLPIASSELVVPVSATLSIDVEPPVLSGEVGESSEIVVEIAGGVAPFHVAAQELGSLTPVDSLAAADGSVLVPLEDVEPGSLPVVVNVTDALGVGVTGTTTLTVEPTLILDAGFGRALTTASSSVTGNFSVTSGAPPFYWCVGASGPTSSNTPFAGIAGAGDPFGWSGEFDPEASATVTLEVFDPSGATGNASVSSLAVAPFTAVLGASAGAPGDLEVTAELEGGVPPFTFFANASTGGPWTTSESSDGDFRWTVPEDASGPVNVSLVVVDRFGYSFEINATVDLGIRAIPSTPSAIGEVAAGSVAIALIVAGGIWWRQHRRGRSVPPTPPDPEAVLRRILEPADGADRPTVELLAEEAGIPLDLARSTIDRLVGEGRIRSDTTSDGEEVLAWSPSPST